VQDDTDIDPAWLQGIHNIGISSGASTPDILVQRVIAALNQHAPHHILPMPGVEEDVVFRLPAELA
jgi:4-hydroxy-3-methylbut-2-enyl diphosphate reductase